MKQFRLSIAVLLAVWGLAGMGDANADNGSGANGVKIEKSENKKVRLYIPNAPSKTAVDVAVIDAEGNVLYKGIVAHNKAGRQLFNLANLPDGQYFITATSDAWWMSQGITVKGNALSVDARNLQQVSKPTVVAYEKNKVEVTLPASNLSGAHVTIYDAQSTAVYSDKFAGTTRRFDLSSLPDGAYTVVVGPDQKQFSTPLTIRH
ncbi:hypothetical protein [Spirosoma montaniterrae]|uniref:Secretion system C-terminal sorting domain-containing protein n=1 Tax=Spirosoma montaniterrae TaxID=1178516 RepID=A0A1P9WT78_9BACT|nr:hypothetical protein [Spirosoma montaniterrae]AQG78591.1 hypothetical protein AWR27_04075 [Spirosoma montaniterrae]